MHTKHTMILEYLTVSIPLRYGFNMSFTLKIAPRAVRVSIPLRYGFNELLNAMVFGATCFNTS